MALGEWFEQFNNNLKIQNSSTISSRYKSITRRLNTDFWDKTSDVAHSLYVGSYGRNTAIHGISDLDIIFQLPFSTYKQYDNYYGNGQSALLQQIKQSIEKTYPVTNTKADGQVIQVPFNDGIIFEVVPAFINKDDSYTFPDANNGGSWKATNPRAEINAIKTRNGNCNNNLIRLCRMLRSWKSMWNVPIGGLLIDTLAYQFIENYEYRDKSYYYYDWMSRDCFKWMAEQNSEQMYWKAPGSGSYVYGKGLFQYKAKRCYNIALEAINYESATPKLEWSAKKKWREIYGTQFPN